MVVMYLFKLKHKSGSNSPYNGGRTSFLSHLDLFQVSVRIFRHLNTKHIQDKTDPDGISATGGKEDPLKISSNLVAEDVIYIR